MLFRKIALVTTVLAVVASVSIGAQSPLQYDVVSIKPHKPGDNSQSVSSYAGKYDGTNLSVKDIIAGTYHVKAWLIFQLPPWAESMKWDISAKVSDADEKALSKLTRDDREAMMKQLLAEHFGLALHTDTKMQPVFEMTVMHEGPKFKAAPIPPPKEDGTKAKYPGASTNNSNSSISAHHIRMDGFAEILSYRVDRTIVNRTNLDSEFGYDLELKWTPDEGTNGNDNGTNTDAPPPLFESVKEQLGLRLSPTKAEVPTLVIDHIQQPESN